MRSVFTVFRLKNCTFLLSVRAVFTPFAAVAQTLRDSIATEYVHIDTITVDGNRKIRVALSVLVFDFWGLRFAFHA